MIQLIQQKSKVEIVHDLIRKGEININDRRAMQEAIAILREAGESLDQEGDTFAEKIFYKYVREHFPSFDGETYGRTENKGPNP